MYLSVWPGRPYPLGATWDGKVLTLPYSQKTLQQLNYACLTKKDAKPDSNSKKKLTSPGMVISRL
jgi:hypothetical protein